MKQYLRATYFMLLGLMAGVGLVVVGGKIWWYIKVLRTMDHILQNSHVLPQW
jgi:ABC-type transporter Mla subunit MlaD